jgi:amidase
VTTWELVDYGQRLSAVDIERALGQLQAAAWQIAEFFERYDVWLTPSLAQPPPPLGQLNRSLGGAMAFWERDLEFSPWTPIANVTGRPSASLPLDQTGGGLPIGSLVTGQTGDEATLLQLAAQLERARPWSHRAADPRTSRLARSPRTS